MKKMQGVVQSVRHNEHFKELKYSLNFIDYILKFHKKKISCTTTEATWHKLKGPDL